MTATVETAAGRRHRHPAQAARAGGHGPLAGTHSRALGQPDWLISRVINDVTRTVTPEFRADAVVLYDAWWCLRPPERTLTDRVAAAAARARAQRCGWCTGAGLDDDELDVPGYRPRATYRPAEGVGVATDPYPLGRRRSA